MIMLSTIYDFTAFLLLILLFIFGVIAFLVYIVCASICLIFMWGFNNILQILKRIKINIKYETKI